MSWTPGRWALLLSAISTVLYYLIFTYVEQPSLIGDTPLEYPHPSVTSLFFGGATFLGVLLWTMVGMVLEKRFPELRGKKMGEYTDEDDASDDHK